MMHHLRTCRRRRNGFTMLELAVVLGIIALVAGAGLTMASGALKAADRVTTQERLNTIKLALDSFGKTYGYLPCPANRTALPSAADFGKAHSGGCSATQGASPYEVEVASNVAVGAVPVRTLGLPDSYASDAWGNKMSYAVSNRLTVDPTRYARYGGSIAIRYGRLGAYFQQLNQRISARSTDTDAAGDANNDSGAGLMIDFDNNVPALASGSTVHVNTIGSTSSYNGQTTTRAANSGTEIRLSMAYSADETNTVNVEWTALGASAAYAVISHGPDGRGAFPLQGTSVPTNKKCNNDATANTSPAPCASSGSPNCIDIENCETTVGSQVLDAIFFDTAYNDGTVALTYFDDYIVWGSNDGYRAPIYTNLYTSASTNNCPSDTCQPWCAKCTYNYPGAAATVPPTGLLDGSPPLYTLCKKVIYSNKSACEASCFWSGKTNTPANGYYRCP